MATSYKTFISDDVTTSVTLLHENIPITGSLVSGAYSEKNIKNFSHKRFQSVYDYPFLSSSANHIFDISVGITSNSPVIGLGADLDNNKKIQMYNMMAQLLVGHDTTGSILSFDRDGNLSDTSDKHTECVFLTFSRLLVKDEIKKGTVSLEIGTGSYGASVFDEMLVVQDHGASNEYRINSPAGEYGILYTGSAAVEGTGVGLVFYQAGIMVLTASVFAKSDGTDFAPGNANLGDSLSDLDIQDLSDVVRHRIKNIQFNNTVELNSTIYFCRINHNEFNYSSNPTYISGSRLRVKQFPTDQPVSYITTVGLYSSNNELLAVAKLSEPLKKTPENTLILRTRLDF